MIVTRKFDGLLRVLTGSALIIHGLIHVFLMREYVDAALIHFSTIINNDSLLIIGATFLPFLEVLSGLLISFRLGIKHSVLLALSICTFMSIMIILGDMAMYRLVFHGVVITGLLILYVRNRGVIITNSLI